MQTITVPLDEYLKLLDLYRQITKQLESIDNYRKQNRMNKPINIWDYCGTIQLNKDPLLIQKEMRDEWE